MSKVPDFSHLGRYKELLFSSSPPELIDLETAKLKLAFLKENFKFQEFYKEFCKDPDSFISVYPNPNKPQEKNFRPKNATPFFSKIETGEESKDLRYYCRLFGLNPKLEMILWAIGWPFSDFMVLFDPKKEISEVKNQDLINALPFFFNPSGVTTREPGYKTQFFYDLDKPDESSPGIWKKLQPYEHIMVVDLRKRKSQLLNEFERFIDDKRDYQRKIKKEKSGFLSDQTYYSWEPENIRQRKEAWRQIKIWKLRKTHKTFPEISLLLGIKDKDGTGYRVKQDFYRAFELTQGKKYDRNIWKKFFPSDEVKQQHLLVGQIEYSKHGGSISNSLDSDPEVNLLLMDIDRICKGCSDIDCYKAKQKAFRDKDPSLWDACPKILAFLKD